MSVRCSKTPCCGESFPATTTTRAGSGSASCLASGELDIRPICPIPADTNPHKLIASYAKDMQIVVLNGHVHTTESYDVDGVNWNGQPPKEDYNYVVVDVQPGQKTKFTLNRYRPWSAEPFATVDPYGASE